MAQQSLEVPLYEGSPPGSEHWTHDESWGDIFWSSVPVLRNVSKPTLTVHLPEPAKASGAGVILAPGGGWHFLAFQQEGTDVANWLNERGIAAFVLKYRLIHTGDDYNSEMHHNKVDPQQRAARMQELKPLILSDGQQALRLMRQHATQWGIDPLRVGMMGYSAGGNVALNVALQHDETSRPAFVAGIYTAGPDDVPIPSDAPPLLLLCTADDAMASGNSIRLYQQWREAGVAVELHIYEKGGHGFCLRRNNLPVDDWIERFHDWLLAGGFVTATAEGRE